MFKSNMLRITPLVWTLNKLLSIIQLLLMSHKTDKRVLLKVFAELNADSVYINKKPSLYMYMDNNRVFMEYI